MNLPAPCMNRPVPQALVLTPGAGGSASQESLVDLERRLAGRLTVLRHDFAYRRAGRKRPPPAQAVCDELLAELPAIADSLGTSADRLLIGGRSFGGRVCSMAAAAGVPLAGLVLLSYPLHPPQRPDRPRTAHFSRIRVPTLFVSGDRDPFGTPAELTAAVSAIPGPVTVQFVPGARHDPRSHAHRQAVAEHLRHWLDSLASPGAASCAPR